MGQNTIGYTESMHYSCLEDFDQAYTLKTINPLLLAYCGREDCSPGWSFGPYIRENYVIHVITGGKGIYKVRGKEYSLSEGQMFLLYPGEETVYQADEDDPWSYRWVAFSGYRAEKITEEIGFLPEEPFLTLNETKKIAGAIDLLLEYRQLTNTNLLKRMAGLYNVLALMIEHSGNERILDNSSPAKYVNMAVELITESYDKKIRISDIADKVGINRSYLTSIFKKEMNMSPQEYLINFRLEKAAQMLRETQEPIGSISSSVGYSDPLAFSKAFRQKYGFSPSEYRGAPAELTLIDVKGGYNSIHRL